MEAPVLIVNGQALTAFELSNAMQAYAHEIFGADIDDLETEQQEECLRSALGKLEAWELIYQHAEAQGIATDEAEVEQEIGNIAAQFESREAMETALRDAGADPTVLHRSVRREFLVSNVLEGLFDAIPEPDEADVAAGYRQYVEALEGEEPKPREEVDPDIREFLRQQAGSERVEAWIEQLREQAEIEHFVEL